MKAYKVYTECRMGFEDDVMYFSDINWARSYHKHLIKKLVSQSEMPDREESYYEDFEDDKYKIKKGVIYPIDADPLTPSGKKIIAYAIVPTWETRGYYEPESDITDERVTLEEIEIK